MDPRRARRIALAALLLGVIGDVLFDRQALGVNLPVAVALALVVATLCRPAGATIDRLDLWIPPVALLAALGVSVRTDPPIVLLDLWLAVVATLAWALAVAGRALTRQSAAMVATLGASAAAWLGVGSVVVARTATADGSLGEAAAAVRRRLPIVRGLLIAGPVVLVLAMLLASADAAFESLLKEVVRLPFDVSDVVGRGAVVLAIAWLAGGTLSIAAGALPLPWRAPRTLGAAASARSGWLALPGATEALVVIVAVDLLFGTFAAVQVSYLFGGLQAVLGTGITFSDYAREGYFQLVAVVAIAGLLLAVAEAAAHRTRTFLVAALGLIGLTAVILASAAVRLGLYQQIYGWTELRFYVAASIAWLAIGGVVLVALVVRDQMRWLLHGLAFGAIVVTLVVTALGPQAFITARNLERALDPTLVPPEGHAGLDAVYLAALGDDAVPEIVAALPRLDAASRAALLPVLEARRAELASDARTMGWPAWNLAREQARQALSTLPR